MLQLGLTRARIVAIDVSDTPRTSRLGQGNLAGGTPLLFGAARYAAILWLPPKSEAANNKRK